MLRLRGSKEGEEIGVWRKWGGLVEREIEMIDCVQ